MAKKVIKIGSSLGITLGSNFLKKMGLSKGDDIEVAYNQKKQCLEIFKSNDSETEKESGFLKKIDDLTIRYSQELEKLTNEW